jgi:hypothetical protein
MNFVQRYSVPSREDSAWEEIASRLREREHARVRTQEDALRREFGAHGWREWIEVVEESPSPYPGWMIWNYPEGEGGIAYTNEQSWSQTAYDGWLVIRRRPRDPIDWLRHKAWAVRVWWACRQSLGKGAHPVVS